ncbi:MAG: Tat pathway signal protein, partial [Albidovulum sp.]
MTDSSAAAFSRRGLLAAFAATVAVAAPTCSNAFGLLRGAGDVRRISMYSGRTGETLNSIYWIEG